ncbi:hypothetical protein TorRG33x02_050720 [Trema orientale]|uniref:Uncharacterized protein n=1 Tax=Trema orientale TaxID=63057 RepID=A0A2P5FN38_TREOI|nr:hypothetical protein TorRG33x02_050720 [Trema orientale]
MMGAQALEHFITMLLYEYYLAVASAFDTRKLSIRRAQNHGSHVLDLLIAGPKFTNPRSSGISTTTLFSTQSATTQFRSGFDSIDRFVA